MLYPDGIGVGPDPGEDAKVLDARNTGRARVDDVDGGSQILVPVSRGGNSACPRDAGHPGHRRGAGHRLGGGRRVGPARPARRSPCWPARWWSSTGSAARSCSRSGSSPSTRRPSADPARPRRWRRSTVRPRCRSSPGPSTGSSAGSSCCSPASARTSPTCPTACAPPSPRCGCGSRASPTTTCASGSASDLDSLQATVDEIVREARRSEREGLDPQTDAVAVLAERVRHWEPLAEDQGRA